eukprot:781537-Pleurochrysis_carterae.AAC.1
MDMESTTTINDKTDMFARTCVGRNAEINARAASAAAVRTSCLWRVKRRMSLFNACARFARACVRSGRSAALVHLCRSCVIGRDVGRQANEVTGCGRSMPATRRDNWRTGSIGSVILQVVPSRETT